MTPAKGMDMHHRSFHPAPALYPLRDAAVAALHREGLRSTAEDLAEKQTPRALHDACALLDPNLADLSVPAIDAIGDLQLAAIPLLY